MKKLKNVGIVALVLALSLSLVWQILLDNPSPIKAVDPNEDATGRTATYVVAAADAPTHVQAQADYVCDGTADDVEINEAIEATGCADIRYTTASPLPATVKLEGNFSTTDTITVPSYLTLDLTDARITLDDDSDCTVITVSSGYYASGGISYRAHIIGGVVDQNGANQASGYCILFQGYRGSIKNTMILSGKDGGLRLTPGTSPSCFENVFEGLQIFDWVGGTNGMSFMSGATDNLVHNCVIAKNIVDPHSGICIYVSAGGNTFTANHFYWGYCSIYIKNKTAIGIFDNYFNGVSNDGGYPLQIVQTGNYDCSHIVVDGNYFFSYQQTDTDSHIMLNAATAGRMKDIIITDNAFGEDAFANHCIASIGVAEPEGCVITGNSMADGFDETAIDGTFTNSTIEDNNGYIHSGEIRSISGSFTGGSANSILFAQRNPEAQDCFIMKVVINVTTLDADAANIDCGIEDAGDGTNLGTEFFDDLPGETIQINDSWDTANEGQQTKWVLWEDNASGTDSYVTAQILDNDGSSIVGSYYIQYCGK